jgi:hypothetical protein
MILDSDAAVHATRRHLLACIVAPRYLARQTHRLPCPLIPWRPMLRSRLPAALLMIPLFACAPGQPRPAAAPVTDAGSLVRAMHDRYAGRWFNTMAFSQKTTRTPPNAAPVVETWDEYAAFPGRLRIETPAGSANGAIYSGDSLFVVQQGRVAVRRKDRNPLLTLGFDVYFLAPERTLELLREHGFALGTFHTDTWQGRHAYVVGAAPGDLRAPQFWVDAERLVFVRMLLPTARDTTKIQDVRFNRYEPAAGGWVAPEAEFLVDGARVMLEEYSNVRVDVPLDPSLFDPERWSAAVHP